MLFRQTRDQILQSLKQNGNVYTDPLDFPVWKDSLVGNPEVDIAKEIITASIIFPNGEKEHALGRGVMRDMEDFNMQCTMEAAHWRAVGKIKALG
ncbi:hypothetical protein KUTeg_020421 [Tegillarca granosa]|uniref:Uncharacterized protein n=1 Tax=Tegillarca granosa TaxID=220873 RepID=A0ABQ9E7W5_TEGGR|nr:hypothetical protein KUTeg_020421 [Tegillarca granosa]